MGVAMSVMRRVLLVGLGLGLGCGGDGDGAGASSGVTPSAQLGKLDTTQARQLCEWASSQVDESSFEPTKQQACTLFGISFTDNPTDCRAFADACVQAPDENDGISEEEEEELEEEEDDCATAMVDAELMGCTATVSEYEACVRAAVDAIERVFASLSCEQAGMSDLEGDVAAQEPEACKALEAKCPDVFQDEDEDAYTEEETAP
jgi:hypothetical protein